MKNGKRAFKKGDDDMDIDQKKGFSPVVTISTLLFVSIITIFTYNSWFSNYLDDRVNDVEERTKLPLIIDSIKGQNLYLNNPNNFEVNLREISIDGFPCKVNNTLVNGFNTVDVSFCNEALPVDKYEVLVESEIGSDSKYLYLKNTPEYNPYSIGGRGVGGSGGPMDGRDGFGDGCRELQNMYNDLDGDYYLIEDVYCYDLKSWNNGEGFLPVGNVSNPFTGSLDGRGYTIHYLYINSTSKESSLFGRTSGATIRNLSLVSEFVEGEDKSVGGIAGYAQDTWIDYVHISGNMTANKKAGGGIVGELHDSNITRSSFTNGVVNGDRKSVGGLVGEMSNSRIENSYSTGNVIGDRRYVGGLVGEQFASIVVNSYAAGFVFGNQDNGGLIGNSNGAWEVNDSYWNTDTTTILVSDGGDAKTTIEMFDISTFSTWDTNIWSITSGKYPTLK